MQGRATLDGNRKVGWRNGALASLGPLHEGSDCVETVVLCEGIVGYCVLWVCALIVCTL